jgi:hypothetical protein
MYRGKLKNLSITDYNWHTGYSDKGEEWPIRKQLENMEVDKRSFFCLLDLTILNS